MNLLLAIADLVLPAACGACAAHLPPRLGQPLCPHCKEALFRLDPIRLRPPPPPGRLPSVAALGGYGGPLRDALIAYKERRRRDLAPPLAYLLTRVLRDVGGRAPLLLVPVPATAAALRRRRGHDHMRALADRAAAQLRARGRPAVVVPGIRARDRPDSVGLTRRERLASAAGAYGVTRNPWTGARLRREAAGRVTVVVDDVMTTGATLGAMAATLEGHGVEVDAGAVLAGVG